MQLILLPGMDGTGILFKAFMDGLPEDLTVIPVAYPADASLSYPQLAEIVRTALPMEEDFIVVAESYSGPVAYLLAQNPVPNLKAVVFIATFLESPRPVLLRIITLLPLQFFFSIPVPKYIVKYFLFGLSASKENILLFREAMNKVRGKVLGERLRAISKLSLQLSRNNQLQVKAVYIQALEDKLVPARNVRLFQRCFKNLTLFQIPGPHFLLQSNPLECARIVLDEIREKSQHRR